MNINIILNKNEGMLELLYTGYNIIKKTIYNEELTDKIINLIEEGLKTDGEAFTTLENFLKMQ